MKKAFLAVLPAVAAFFHSFPAFAAVTIDDWINEKMAPVSGWAFKIILWKLPVMGAEIPFILIWLAGAAIFFTFYLNFINLRMFGHAFSLIRIKCDKSEGAGDISNFQALATSLSATVGLGNIAGVAVAISTGGPGAMVWMIVMGFLGMSSKFAECALGIKYRHVDPQGEMSGGPMYYLREGFAKRGMPRLGKIMGGVFALCAVGGAFGGGNMFQANQTHKMIVTAMGGEGSFFADKGWLFGILLAVLAGAVIIGGIKSIARVSEKIVPLMGVVYMLAGFAVIAVNYEHIPAAFGEIFRGAFAPEAIGGGIIGVLIVGVQRAAFSNEAGLGSAAIAYAAVKTNSHVEQGIVAMLGPFIDTVVICTMTALVIVISGTYVQSAGIEGVALTSRAFASVISWFPHVLAFAVFLFAFSTIIGWEYYGMKGATYLFGETRTVEMTYKLLYCFCIVIGSAAQLGNLIDFTDAMILSLAFPNIVGLYLLASELKKDVRAYEEKLGKERKKSRKTPRKAKAV